MDETRRTGAAEALATAERTRQAIAPLSAVGGGLTVDDAYEIQKVNIRRRLGDGRQIYGHKVGLTSKAMQDALGISEPDYGYLLDDMLVIESVAADRYLQPRVEIEIAFILGEDLGGSNITAERVLEATSFVTPAIEIIDSRIMDWKITLEDTIADNASSAGIVLGRERTSPDGVNLAGELGELRVNGQLMDQGTGEAVLGHPANAVAWLANKLGEFGTVLQAGQVILPGSVTRAVDVASGDHVLGTFSTLGEVSLQLT